MEMSKLVPPAQWRGRPRAPTSVREDRRRKAVAVHGSFYRPGWTLYGGRQRKGPRIHPYWVPGAAQDHPVESSQLKHELHVLLLPVIQTRGLGLREFKSLALGHRVT